MQIAKFARFYSTDITKVERIPYLQFMAWWECITTIEAQEMLMSLNVQDWSYKKQSDREKTLKKLNRDAYPASLKETKGQVSNDALARALGRG